MIDKKTLEAIKEKEYLKDKDFSSELHKLIKSFYEGFDLDKRDKKYRDAYIRDFVGQHEAFLINYQTNVYRANLNTTDRLSEELTLNKFLDTLVSYLIKFQEEEEERSKND